MYEEVIHQKHSSENIRVLKCRVYSAKYKELDRLNIRNDRTMYLLMRLLSNSNCRNALNGIASDLEKFKEGITKEMQYPTYIYLPPAIEDSPI